MTLLKLSQLQAVQKMGEMGMNVTVTIANRLPYAKDPNNVLGDEDVMHEDSVTVKGWLVMKPAERFNLGAGEVRTISTHQLRVPVGTKILSGATVTIGDEKFTVTDSTHSQSWPEWTVAYLRGYAG